MLANGQGNNLAKDHQSVSYAMVEYVSQFLYQTTSLNLLLQWFAKVSQQLLNALMTEVALCVVATKRCSKREVWS